MCRCVLILQKYFINMMVLYLQHGLGVWQLLPLVYFDVCLKSNVRKCEFNLSDFNSYQITLFFFPDLEVLQQASAGDFAAVDLLHVDVLGAEEPRDQNLQVV